MAVVDELNPTALSEVQAVFGGAATPMSMSNYYPNLRVAPTAGALVPKGWSTAVNSANPVAGSGKMSLSSFKGTFPHWYMSNQTKVTTEDNPAIPGNFIGYSLAGGYGSIALDPVIGTLGPVLPGWVSGTTGQIIQWTWASALFYGTESVNLIVKGIVSNNNNNAFIEIFFNGQYYERTAATYSTNSANGGSSEWTWSNRSQTFGTTGSVGYAVIR